MQRRFTPRCYPLLLLLGLNFSVGLVLQRPEAVLVALPFLAALLLDVCLSSPPHLQLRYQKLPAVLYEGESCQGGLEITATTPLPLLEMEALLPAGFTCVGGQQGVVLSLPAGASYRLRFTAQAQHRGRWIWGSVLLRSYSSGGLIAYEGQWQAPQTCLVYPQLAFLRRAVLPRHTQLFSGDSVSRRAGEGIEFSTLRPYVPGDVTRAINWRASLRRGQLHVNQYAQEHNADVVLLLDTLSNAGSARVNTLDCCVRAAASLAAASLRRRDRVGLIEYSGVWSWVPPASGRRQLLRLLERLAVAQVHLSYVRRELSLLPPRILPPQALVVALSPLIDERFSAALADLAGRGFDVLLLSLSPAAVLRATVATTPLDAVACQWWELEHRARLQAMRRLGITVLSWHVEEPLAVVVQRVLQTCRRRRQPC